MLFPKVCYMEEFQEANVKFKNQQKRNFDKRRHVLDLTDYQKTRMRGLHRVPLRDREGLLHPIKVNDLT